MDERRKIEAAIRSRLAVPLLTAGRALGLGRRRTLAAAERGLIPCSDLGTVSTTWLRRQLRQAEGSPRKAASATEAIAE
jgi:hypothetical protein